MSRQPVLSISAFSLSSAIGSTTVGAVSNRTDDTTPREAQLETAPTTGEAIRTRCIVSGTAGDFFNGQPKRLDG